MLKYLTAFAILACMSFAAHASMTSLYVINTNDSGAGSLREAIIDGNNLPTNEYPKIYVNLAPGATIELQSSLPAITKSIIFIVGDHAESPARVDGQGLYSLLHQSTTVFSAISLTHLALVNGYASPTGAGCLQIEADAGLFNITNVTFDNCELEWQGGSAYGAAISADGGMLTVTDSVFKSNVSKGRYAGGAAIRLRGDGTDADHLTVRNCRFINNAAKADGGYTKGAAIVVQSAELDVEDSFFLANEAIDLADGSSGGGAGAIGATEADVSVRRSTFAGNSGGWGGAISVTYGLGGGLTGAVFVNNTFASNMAETYGGAIVTQGVNVVLRNNSFYYNDVVGNGNDFQGRDPASDHPTYQIWNNLFGYQYPGDACAIYGNNPVISGYNLVTGPGCGIESDGTSLMVADAALQRYLLDFDSSIPPLRFFADSAALDAGNPITPSDSDITACPELDGQGNPRAVDGDVNGNKRCDIGAFEWQREASLFADDFEQRA